MARLSMNEMTTYRWSFEQDVRNYRAAGIDAIAIWRQKLTDFGTEKGAQLIEETAMSVSSLLWAGGFTGSDGRSYRDSLHDAFEAVQQAARLRAETLIVYSGGRAGHTHNHARRIFRNALQELGSVAADCNVSLAIEPMHVGCAADWTFLTGLDETLDLIAGMNCPSIKLAFDVYHLGQEPGILNRVADAVPHIGIVQLGDALRPPNGEQNRCRLGDGIIPVREICAALRDAGYDGYYDVELIGEDVEVLDYDDLIEQAKAAFAEFNSQS